MFANALSFFPDILGGLGVILTLIAYFLLQLNLLSQETRSFSLLNCVGSALILFSLFYHWNASSVVIEVAWLLISLYGLVKSCVKHRNPLF